MSTTTWPALTTDDLLSGKGASQIVPLAFWDRDQCILGARSTWPQVVASFTNTSFAADGSGIGTRWVRNPSASGTFAPVTVSLALLFRRTVGSGTIHFRLCEVVTGTHGTDVTTTSGPTAWAMLTSVLTLPAREQLEQYEIQAYTSAAGTGQVTGDQVCGNWWFSD
jgi:hypothetical protein